MSKKRRCAIYTRKSTEDGLEQDFNSLDAQREACEAFVLSQKSEGWAVAKKLYDDGGFSGGSMERPGLVSLLEDVQSGLVDVIVVYKVDRLTRSLADFAKIVELLDTHEVSFVSVTQAFNTTSSMGRLTLNVLLSFAQFEREVTAERIRDKIAASKKKGIWMGGLVPIGFDVVERKLVINKTEAKTVQTLFDLYLELDHVRAVVEEAKRRGLRSKLRTYADGRQVGGHSFRTGQLYHLLRNPIYIGCIRHKGEIHQGLHKPIIHQDTWDKVQAKLNAKAVLRHALPKQKSSSFLLGKLFDDTSEPMTTNHAVKQGRRYRYYISKCLNGKQPDHHKGWRIPASEIETTITNSLRSFLTDPVHLMDALQSQSSTESGFATVTSSLTNKSWSEVDLRSLVETAVQRIDLRRDAICISLDLRQIAGNVGNGEPFETKRSSDQVYELTIPTKLRRRGIETKIVMCESSNNASDPNAKLIELIAKSHYWFERLKTGEVNSIAEIAKCEKYCAEDVSRFLPLAFLSPKIVTAILQGQQPTDLTVDKLRRLPSLPLGWDAQLDHLGFSD